MDGDCGGLLYCYATERVLQISHHPVFCPEAGPPCVSRLHPSLFSAALFMAWYVCPCLMSSNILLLFLPLGLFPSALPSMTVLSSPSDRMTYPVHRAFLLQMVLINVRCSPTLLSTASFLTLSVQLIFSILLHTHISKLSSLLMSSFFSVHASEP